MKYYYLFLISIIISVFIFSCATNEKSPCQYKLEQLVSIDTPKFYMKYDEENEITEVRDNSKTNFGGIYKFDKEKNLRFYGFFVNKDQFYYSEEYDSKGNIINTEGVPMLTFNVLTKKNNDTILFTGSLFSLNKKYDGIEIITNKNDTIRPEYLYKSDAYSNSKEFYITLPVAKNINNLIFLCPRYCYKHMYTKKGNFSGHNFF